MARWFSWTPALTYRGRKFKGLRGWAGKPTHPPLTDVPVTCYLLAGAFDLISYLQDGRTAEDFYRAATYVLVAGAIGSLGAIATGFWDWLRSTPARTQAWRTANSHAVIMLVVTVLVVVDAAVRLGNWEAGSPSEFVLVLSLLAAALVVLGSFYGGSLVYDYAFNVEQDIGYAWEQSETDVFPGTKRS
jgi:uncharacterized membrane protein